jgi:hypothetical protein
MNTDKRMKMPGSCNLPVTLQWFFFISFLSMFIGVHRWLQTFFSAKGWPNAKDFRRFGVCGADA